MLCQTILLFHFLHLFHLETGRQIHKIELRVAMMVVVEVISNRMQLKLKIQAKSIRAEKWYIIHGGNLSGNDEPFPLKQNDDGGASSSGPSDSNSISSVLFFMMRMTFLKERESIHVAGNELWTTTCCCVWASSTAERSTSFMPKLYSDYKMMK